MKKKLNAVLCAATMLLSLAGCGGKEAATWQDQLGSKDVIRVGISPDYPPFESYATDANGNVTTEVVGFDVEIVYHPNEAPGCTRMAIFLVEVYQ